jgi:hypothetical protein
MKINVNVDTLDRLPDAVAGARRSPDSEPMLI